MPRERHTARFVRRSTSLLRQELLSSDSSSSDSSSSNSRSSDRSKYSSSSSQTCDASPITHGVDAFPNTPGVDASPSTPGVDASPNIPGVDASPQTSPTTPGTDASLIERVANRACRYRPGPMALLKIRPMRKQTAIVKANLRFGNFVDRLVHEFAEDWQRHVREFFLWLGLDVPLHLPPPSLEIREEIAASMVGDNSLRAFYEKRETLTLKDRQLARQIRGKNS